MATSRALLAFAYVADHFSNTGDIGQGLLALFAPVIAKRAGGKFVAEEFAADVKEMYDIEMHPYVAEAFAPRLAAAGYLVQTANFAQSAAYENAVFELPEAPIPLEALDALLERFADAATDLLRENGIEIPRATLKSGLLDRLVQPDFLGLMVRPDRDSIGPRTVSLKSVQTADARDSERLHLDYLSARFILDCYRSNPTDFNLLVAISSGALASEVILSLQHPPGLGDDFEGLRVVLDGPLIMDALGLGQDDPVKYARLLIDSIKRGKALPFVFQHTVEEIEGAIRSPLENFERGRDLHGPLGRKLLKNPAIAPYLRSILGKLPQLIEGLGVAVLAVSDGDRSRLRAVFTPANEESLAGSIGSYSAAESRLRDARSIADVLRLRGRVMAKSIGESDIVFVTRNTRLARLSRIFLTRAGLMGEDYFPPCITDRYMAGLLWITQGGGGSQLSRERLIANCTNAVMPRRDVVTRMHKFLSGVNPDMAARFEALMTNERAEHFLMDRTVADFELITDKNLEQIYQDVELIAGERVAAQKDAQIEDLMSQHTSELRRLREAHEREIGAAHERSTASLMEESARAVSLETQLHGERERADAATATVTQLQAAARERTISLLQQCVEAGSASARRARIGVGVAMVVIAVGLGLATRFVPDWTSTPRVGVLTTIALIVVTQMFSVINYLIFPDALLARYVKRRRDNAFRARAQELGVEAALEHFEVDWADSRVIERRAD
jgi:hypothetical protein